MPYVEPILKQDYVPNATQATQQEIDGFMAYRGFDKVNEHSFTNGKYTVSDLHPRNVLKNEAGNIFVVDDIVSENQQAKIGVF
ncbi:hypothetical protein AGMMS49965_22370 [Bacteroidia bacterium]|nr:hypothetical protein AGMMS49965_22370 [Bacteroidia bacterium]